MAFARIEAAVLNHRKLAELPLDHIGLWTLALVYSADQLTDGRVPKWWLARQYVTRRASWSDRDCITTASLSEAVVMQGLVNRNAARAKKRVENGFSNLLKSMMKASLFDDAGDDIVIHDYGDWNSSAAQIKAAREAAKNRMREYRSSGERSRERASERSYARAYEHTLAPEACSRQDVDVDVLLQPHFLVRTNSRTKKTKTHRCSHDGTCPQAKPLNTDGLTECTTPDGRPLYVWPTSAIKSRHNDTRWLPGAYPYAAYRHDCSDRNWRGRCVIPGAVGAQEALQQCPEHHS